MRPFRSTPWAFLFVAATAIAVSFTFVLAYFGCRALVPAIPAAPVWAILLLAACPLLGKLARPLAGDRALVVTAMAMSGMGVSVMLGALNALAEPLLYSDSFRCGTPRMMLEMEVPVLLLGVGAALAGGALLPLIQAGREGMLEANGQVALADGDPPLTVAPEAGLAVGPVVVLPSPVSPGGTYRSEGPMAEARVLCGSRDSLLATTRDRVAGLDALRVAAVLLFSAPLVACAVVGILF